MLAKTMAHRNVFRIENITLWTAVAAICIGFYFTAAALLIISICVRIDKGMLRKI